MPGLKTYFLVMLAQELVGSMSLLPNITAQIHMLNMACAPSANDKFSISHSGTVAEKSYNLNF